MPLLFQLTNLSICYNFIEPRRAGRGYRAAIADWVSIGDWPEHVHLNHSRWAVPRRLEEKMKKKEELLSVEDIRKIADTRLFIRGFKFAAFPYWGVTFNIFFAKQELRTWNAIYLLEGGKRFLVKEEQKKNVMLGHVFYTVQRPLHKDISKHELFKYETLDQNDDPENLVHSWAKGTYAEEHFMSRSASVFYDLLINRIVSPTHILLLQEYVRLQCLAEHYLRRMKGRSPKKELLNIFLQRWSSFLEGLTKDFVDILDVA